MTVNTVHICQEPLTPVPSHRGPGAGSVRLEPGREAGDCGPTERVHTPQVSDH